MDNKQLKDLLFQGLDSDTWGYGLKRVLVSPPINVRKKCPYTFTSMGFKDESGKYFIGLRMNVDQNSPIKFRLCVESTIVTESLVNMLKEFLDEYKIKTIGGAVMYHVV